MSVESEVLWLRILVQIHREGRVIRGEHEPRR